VLEGHNQPLTLFNFIDRHAKVFLERSSCSKPAFKIKQPGLKSRREFDPPIGGGVSVNGPLDEMKFELGI
jgi:hypothetical protein